MQKHWCLSRISGHCNWWVWVMSNLFSVCSIQGHANNILFARAPRHATSYAMSNFQLVTRRFSDVIVIWYIDSEQWLGTRGNARVVVSCRVSLYVCVLAIVNLICKQKVTMSCEQDTQILIASLAALIWVGIHLCEHGGSFWSPPTSSLLSSSPSKV